jgi:hypothetical protein
MCVYLARVLLDLFAMAGRRSCTADMCASATWAIVPRSLLTHNLIRQQLLYAKDPGLNRK